MRVALPLLLIAVLVSNVSASVTAKVYLADEEIPLALKDPNVPDVFRDIMVGTHLTIFIESDALVDSAGSLVTSDPVDKGFLAGRGYPVEYQNSVLEAAGPFSFILDVIRFGENGFDFFVQSPLQTGRWFIFDYYATDITEDCNVYLYDCPGYIDGISPSVLTQILSFTQVESRDFNGDTLVDFADFAALASQWDSRLVVDSNDVGTSDPNTVDSLDLNHDGFIDTLDMFWFSDYWLERTDFIEPNDPNEPSAIDPNRPLTEF